MDFKPCRNHNLAEREIEIFYNCHFLGQFKTAMPEQTYCSLYLFRILIYNIALQPLDFSELVIADFTTFIFIHQIIFEPDSTQLEKFFPLYHFYRRFFQTKMNLHQDFI